MRLWEISGLFETFESDGSLQDTLKFQIDIIWNFLIPYLKLLLCEPATHLVFGSLRGKMCVLET